MYDLPVYKVLHKPHSQHLFRRYLRTAHLSLTADTLWWQPSLHIQQSTGIVAVEECKHVGRPTQSFKESAGISMLQLAGSFITSKRVCVCGHVCLRSSMLHCWYSHRQIGFYQSPDGQMNHKDTCQRIPAAGTGSEVLFLSRYSAPLIPDNGFLFV